MFNAKLKADATKLYNQTGKRKGWSIRDCVELCADTLRQLAHEADENREV